MTREELQQAYDEAIDLFMERENEFIETAIAEGRYTEYWNETLEKWRPRVQFTEWEMAILEELNTIALNLWQSLHNRNN